MRGPRPVTPERIEAGYLKIDGGALIFSNDPAGSDVVLAIGSGAWASVMPEDVTG